MSSHRGRSALVCALLLAALATLGACYRRQRLVLGRKPVDAGAPAPSDFGNAEPDSGSTPVGSGPGGALGVQVIQDGAAVELVRVCEGECVDVEATARGGYPPYSFVWDDGSLRAARELCPERTQDFAVTATDSGMRGGEFARPARTETRWLRVEVHACGDGGPLADDAGPDAATSGDGGLPARPLDTTPTCTKPRVALPTCLTLPFSQCAIGDVRRVAALAHTIEPGESPCIWFEMRDPSGGVLPSGGFDITVGTTRACSSDVVIASYSSPVEQPVSEASFGVCPALGEPIRNITMELTGDFARDPQLIQAKLCDVCPLPRL